MNEFFNNQEDKTEINSFNEQELDNEAVENATDDINDNHQQESQEEFPLENGTADGIYSPVNLTPVSPINDYKPMSKGLKLFSLVLAFVIAISSATVVGYYAGKNKNTIKGPVKFQLDSQPISESEMTPSEVFKRVDPSVVGITVYNSEGKGGQASGIVYSEDGYIITNDHIYSQVANAKFKIYTHNGDEYDAKFVAGDTISDIAVIKIDDCELNPASFGDSDNSYAGQRVVAIGRPNDATEDSSITSGIISATNRRVSNSSSYSSRLFQTDTPINPGSSGGALVNMYGQVIGVTSSKLASVQHEGVGYAIPTTVLKRVAEELISKGKVVSRAKLGITYVAVNSVTAEINNLKHTGLRVESVTRDSDLYGKISKGDTIVKINDTEVKTDDMVLDVIESCVAGDKVDITVITTDGKTKTINAELSANVGTSSYTTEEADETFEGQPSGGTFNFPSGE